MTGPNIDVNDFDALNTAIDKLATLSGQIESKLGESSKVTDALTTAATPTDGGSSTVAPIYGETIDAAGTAIDNVGKHVKAAKSSLDTAVSDLKSLSKNLQRTQDETATKIINT